MQTVSFTLNGKPTRVTADPGRLLLWVLRDDLGLTGTKFGCGQAACGSCTVVVGADAVRACATTLAEVQGKSVTTIEGLAKDGRLHPLQEAFVAHAAFQCGFCTPGMIMGAYARLLQNPKAAPSAVLEELEGHLCRCGAHVRIVAAVAEAAAAMKGGAR
jgi:aerobic-type carbon monoxide dehydrogenase small subunit (CoxS/CutS family)